MKPPDPMPEMENIKVTSELSGSVRRISINRPDKRNALSREMFTRLIEAFRSEPPPEERVTVIRAEGLVFCAGVDLTERVSTGPLPVEDLCEAVHTYPLPVVATVQGDAIAGGAFFALAADVVVAADAARFWLNLAQIGLAPPRQLIRNLMGLAGASLTRELLLLGEPVEAEHLAAARVITSAVPGERLEQETNSFVARMAQNAPLSLRAIKAAINLPISTEDHRHVDDLIAKARGSQDGREGVKARLEQRRPRFIGR